MFIEYFLAIVFFDAMATYKPYVVGPMPSKEVCMQEAAKADVTMKDKLKDLGDGAKHACIKVERQSV